MVHQYKLKGYNIVLDTCSGSVHVVDEVDMKTGKVRSKHAKFDNVVEYNCRVCY